MAKKKLKKAQAGIELLKPKRINPLEAPAPWELPNPYEDRPESVGGWIPKDPNEEAMKKIGAYRQPEAYLPDDGILRADRKYKRKDKWNNFVDDTNWGNVALSTLSLINQLVPPEKPSIPVVRPTQSYNPNQYGTGSQAIAKKGVTVSNEGYRQGPPPEGTNYRIPSNRISMKGIKTPIIGTGSDGQQQIMYPEQEYLFPNAEYVDESPAKKGKKVAKQYVSKSYQQGGGIQGDPLAQANIEAKRFSVARNLFQGENAYVDKVPQYLGPDGKPFRGQPTPMTYKLVPQGVTELTFDAQSNMASYIDPKTGYLENADPALMLSPRFRKPTPTISTTGNAMASLQNGGTIPQQASNSFWNRVNQNIPQPTFNFPSGYNANSIDSAEYQALFNIAQETPKKFKNRIVDPAWGAYANSLTGYDEKTGEVIQKGKLNYALIRQNVLENAISQTDKQVLDMYLANKPEVSKRPFKKGGRVKANDGLQVEGNQYSNISDDMIMIGGNSHKNGGTDLAYAGQTVEAEAGEPAFMTADQSLVIAGNLRNPLTGNKFKHDAKMIGKKEAKIDKLMDYSTTLVQTTNPYDKWENLKFNAGRAMMTGAKLKSNELKMAKEHLSDLQEAMLQLDGEGSEMAQNGLKMEAQNGTKLSMAQRHNNPGNIKFAKWLEKYGAIVGDPGTDGGNFAKFPDVELGKRAMVALLTGKNYKNLTVEQAAKRWTGGAGYNNIPSDLKQLKVKDLSSDQMKLALDTFTLGEDSKKYNWAGVDNPVGQKRTTTPQRPIQLGRVKYEGTPTQTGQNPPMVNNSEYKYDWSLRDPVNKPVPTDAKDLQFTQILPEIYAAATNQPEPVHMQQYNPELYQDYNVSLQDRRNRVTSQGRASRQYLGDNANAQATIAAGEYDAINNIDAEEFRINQGIAQDVLNKNKSLLNEAQLKNLGLADLQYTRQSTARSKTKSTNQAILNSVSNKVLQNQLENRTLQVYENLYPHFRYGDNYVQEKVGPPGQDYLNPLPPPASRQPPNVSTKATYDEYGALKRVVNTSSSVLDADLKQAQIVNERLKSSPTGLNTQGLWNKSGNASRERLRRLGIGL